MRSLALIVNVCMGYDLVKKQKEENMDLYGDGAFGNKVKDKGNPEDEPDDE